MPTLELGYGTLARRTGRIASVLFLIVLPFGWTTRGQTYLIAGRITDGINGVSGVNVQATGVTQVSSPVTTDANGNYSIPLSSQPDNYTVTPTKAKTDFRPVSCVSRADCGTNTLVGISATTPALTNVDFYVVYTISGVVAETGVGLSGVQLTVPQPIQRSGTTDQNGNYTLSGFPRGGPYAVTATKANYTFETDTLFVTVVSNMTGANFAAHALFSVSGRISIARSQALPGVSVLLQNAGSLVTLTNKTDDNGSYAFGNLAFGTYTVTPKLAGYSFSPPSVTVSNQSTVNFTVALVSVTGRLIETNGVAGVASWPVYAISATNVITTNSDANGFYTFKNLAGSYTIMPSQDVANVFNPGRRTLSVGSTPGSVDFQKSANSATAFDVLVTSCDFPSLQLALSSGGTVGFDCGSTVGTVTFTETVTIATNTFLDAAGAKATFSGGNAVRLFTVNPGSAFTLKNLSLTAGRDAGAGGTNGAAGFDGNGGAIYNNGGMVVLSNCVLSANAATGGNGAAGVVQLNGTGGNGGGGGNGLGGAIFNNGGWVFLTNCVLSGNTASGGTGANGADGLPAGNGRDGGAGGAGGVGAGGVIYSTGGAIVVYDCTFASNHVSGANGGTGGEGTGLGFDGANGSAGQGLGGSIRNDGGSLTALFSTFNDNGATGATGGDGKPGADRADGASGTSGGVAGGGAIHNYGGSLAATNCTFDANTVAAGQGGNGGAGGNSGFGGDGGDGGSGGTGSGGAIWNTASGSIVLVNCTITDNSAQGGAKGTGGAAGTSVARSGIDGLVGKDDGGGIANTSGTIILANTLLGYSSAGGNGSGIIKDVGHNLSDDGSFAFTESSSFTNSQLELGFLSNNGGPTFTVPIISSGTPPVNAGDDALCLPVDQRHYARVGACDVGAFEFNGATPTATLRIRGQSNQVVVAWSTALSGYSLQSTPGLAPVAWTNLAVSPVVISNQFVVTNAASGPSGFFRLRRP